MKWHLRPLVRNVDDNERNKKIPDFTGILIKSIQTGN
jgi:hypothetical protein